jgi:hypothetical protein
MRSFITKQHLLLFFVIGIIITGCNNNSPKKDVVISVNDRDVYWDDLWHSFHLEPKWSNGLTQMEAFNNQVEYLIDQKCFAIAAENEGLREMPQIAKAEKFSLHKNMIKALYNKVVTQKVVVDEEALRNAYHLSKRKVRYQYFLTTAKANAQYYQKAFHQQNFDDILLLHEQDEKGTTDFMGFGDMDQRVERVALTLPLNEVSEPISVGTQWVVLKVIDGKVDKFLSENDFAAQKPKLRKIIAARKARSISNRFIFELLKDEDIHIDGKMFKELGDYFAEVVRDKQSSQPFPVYLNDAELNDVTRMSLPLKNEVLVKYGDNTMSVGEFLEYLNLMPTGFRPQVNHRSALKQAIAKTVRDQYLINLAYEQKLDRDPEVLHQTQLEVDNQLARAWLKLHQEQLTCTDEEISAFKSHENFSIINQRFNNQLTDEEIRNILLDKKFILKKMMLADSLRQIYRIHQNKVLIAKKIDKPNELIKHKPVGLYYREKFW